MTARVAELEAEIARLTKNSSNSSKPPSTEHPHSKPDRAKPKSKRKAGGQQDHPKHERALIPTEHCQEVVPCIPTQCRRCGKTRSGTDAEPLRHQVAELPEIKPIITEYQQHRLVCSCGCSTGGKLPAGVPSGQAGPRLIAFVALLMACFRQSKRRAAMFLGMVLNQPASAGWMVTLQNHAADVPKQLLGDDYAGVVHCDRARMYWAFGRLQWCWAHLKRDFQALIDGPCTVGKRLGHDLMRPTKEMFTLWQKVRDGTITRPTFGRRMQPIRQRVNALLLRGYFNARTHGFCKELYNYRERLWTFVAVDGVEPTNNAAEQALRHAVIWRKLSFGTQSPKGSRFVERLLTVIETCCRQGRHVYDWLVQATRARFAGQRAPSLLSGA